MSDYGIIHSYLGCIHGRDYCQHGCHDDLTYYRPSASAHYGMLVLEWHANHEGDLL